MSNCIVDENYFWHIVECERCKEELAEYLMPRVMELFERSNVARAKKTEMTAEVSTKLFEWKQQSEQLAVIKDKEFALRQWLVNNAGFDPAKIEGSQTLDIGNGWKLSADKTQNYSVTNDNGEIMQALNLIGSATGLDRPDLAQSLVNWKPNLSVKTYKDVLPLIDKVSGLKEALAAAITIKQGAPQLVLLPPKAEGETSIETNVQAPS